MPRIEAPEFPSHKFRKSEQNNLGLDGNKYTVRGDHSLIERFLAYGRKVHVAHS